MMNSKPGFTPMQASLEQARAGLRAAESRLANSKTESERFGRLVESRMVKKLVPVPALCKKSLLARNSYPPSHPEKIEHEKGWVQYLPAVPHHAARDGGVREGPATLLVGTRTNVCMRTLQERR